MRFIAKICVDTQGSVRDITVVRGQSEAINAGILATLWAWQYQPYSINHRAVPFCYVASFLFKTQ